MKKTRWLLSILFLAFLPGCNEPAKPTAVEILKAQILSNSEIRRAYSGYPSSQTAWSRSPEWNSGKCPGEATLALIKIDPPLIRAVAQQWAATLGIKESWRVSAAISDAESRLLRSYGKTFLLLAAPASSHCGSTDSWWGYWVGGLQKNVVLFAFDGKSGRVSQPIIA
jgi:hypothetical protein